MKFKLLFAFLFLGAFLIQINAQTLDQNASWPNISWTVTGTFNTDPLAFEADPSTSSNFAFDDDDAGSGSDDTIAAESPVIDLSAAFTAGETLLTISGDYIYRKVNVELLQFEYFDADASTWNLISPTVASTTTSTSNNFCSGTPLTYTSNELDISGFTSTQLAGFRYRIFYDDDPSGAGYKWGFCFSSPTITSAAPPSCIEPSMLTATAITPFAADLGWTENGTASLWNVEVVDITAGETVTGIATASGIMNPYTVTGLTPDNDYEFYVQADCGIDGTSTWAGPFAFTTGIACPAPSSLTVSNITDTTADLGWTENGTATIWDLEIVTSGTTPTGTPTNTGVTINPYGATMLTANTAYQFYVRAECGGMNGVSTWSGPFNFTTECGAFTPDYLEDFSSYVPQCWTEAIDGDPVNGPATLQGSNWGAEEFAHLSSSGNGAVNVNIYQTGDVEWLLSPSIDLSAGGYEINLDVAFTNYNSTAQGDFDADDDVRLLYTEDGSTWVTIIQWNDANDNEPAGGGETFNFDLSGITGSNVRFALYSDEGATASGDKDFHIDNFQIRTIPNCQEPTALTVSNLTTSSADLEWTVSGSGETLWDIEYGATGFVQGAGTLVDDTSDNPYSLSSLSSGVTYDYYVRAHCGAGNEGAWSGPFTFRIPNLGDICDTPLSAVVNADCAAGGASTLSIDFSASQDILSQGCDTGTGNRGYYISFTAPASGNIEISHNGSNNEFRIIDNCATGTQIECGNLASGQVISGLTPSSNYIMTIWKDSFNSLTTDEFCFSEVTCLSPSNLTVSNLTTSSADLEWTVSGSGETLWDIEYGATGFVQGAGTLVDDTSDNPYSLSSLSSGVTYDYYVRAHCGAGNEGAWSGPFTFRIPNLGDICDTPLSAVVNADCAAGGASTLSIDFSASQDILSQGCDTGTGNRGYYISFTAPASGNIEISHNGSNNEFRIIDNCATGTQIECGNLASGQVISGLTPSSNYIMTIWKDSFNSLTTDEFCFSEVTCLSPSNLTVSNLQSTSADLGWTPGGSGESSWEIEYGLDGFTQGTGTTVSPATNPQSITGLTSNTGYDYYVRANCGGGDFSEWSGPFNFTTSVGPHNFPLYEDFESGFSFFENVVGNDTDFILTTTYFHTGSQSVQNAHGSSELNYLHETGVLDLSTSTSPEMRFWHIAKTEGTWDECYVQISTDGGMTYTNLPASAYSGNSLDYDTEGYFHEDSYAIWGTTDSTPDNATWWQEEVFSLDAYKVANVRIRFFLDSDSSANREGWFIDDIVVQEAATDYTWDGTAWNISPEGSITANDNMIVQSGMMPSLTSAISVNNLTIEPGASLEANNGNITVAGNLINNGSIISANQLIMNSATGSVSGTGSMTNFTVGATSVVAVSGSQSISGTLDVLSGGSLDAGGNVTMVSNAMGTARIDETDAGAIIGDVNVERYIPAGNRAYRFIGSTVSGPTVFDSWQEGGANDPGFGTHVSGTVGTAGTVNATTGHDETLSGAQSMFLWNAGTQAWAGVSNTRTEVLNAGTFYRMLVRGDRTTDLSNDASVPAATTLRATGTLQQTAYSVTPGIASGQFFTFANPYQSKLDMSTSATGTAVDMYYWDPTLGMFGDYVAINVATGSNTAGTATNVLEPGQAVFFRDNSGASVVSVSQSDKTPGTSNAAVFNTSNLQQTLRLKLYQTSRYNNNLTESDGLYIDFAAGHNLNLDGADAVKLNGANTNISIAKNTGEFYEVERRPLPSSNETVPLAISNYLSDNYTVVATLDALPGVTAYFKDNFTGNLTPITQNASTAINFTVDVSNAASMDSARFEIVFEVVVLNTGDISFSEGIKVYPNPVDGDELHISIGAAIEGDIQITLVNTLGQQVISKVYKGIATEVITLNNLSQLEKGLYIATISNGRNTVAKKLILN